MKVASCRKKWVGGGMLALAGTLLMSPGFALGNENQSAVSLGDQALIAQGERVEIPEIGLSIVPPTGWEVRRDYQGLSLFMQEPLPKDQKPDYEKPQFQRNITVANMFEAVPVTENFKEDLKTQILAEFSKSSLVKEYSFFDEKTFNYKGDNDGLIFFSQFLLNDIPTVQMHVYLSGEENRILLTYTDLKEAFEANQAAYEAAWASIISSELTGRAPKVYEPYLPFAFFGGPLMLIVGIFLAFRRRGRRALEHYSTELELGSAGTEDPVMTEVMVWNLEGTDDPISGLTLHSEVSGF